MDNRNPSTYMLHLSDNATTSVAVKCRKGDDGEKVRTVVLASVDDSGYHEFVFFCRSA